MLSCNRNVHKKRQKMNLKLDFLDNRLLFCKNTDKITTRFFFCDIEEDQNGVMVFFKAIFVLGNLNSNLGRSIFAAFVRK